MEFLGKPISGAVFLAPMAGVTDFAFRTVCAELGAAVTVTEMVSSRALVYQDKKTRSLLGKNPGSLCGAQIFGNDPQIMAQADKDAKAICARAQEQAKEILENARQEAEEEKKRQKDAIRDQVMELSVALAGRILEREINPKDHQKLMEEFLSEVK